MVVTLAAWVCVVRACRVGADLRRLASGPWRSSQPAHWSANKPMVCWPYGPLERQCTNGALAVRTRPIWRDRDYWAGSLAGFAERPAEAERRLRHRPRTLMQVRALHLRRRRRLRDREIRPVLQG